MPMQTFINLAVKDLGRATEFFSAVGFSFDPPEKALAAGADALGDAEDEGFMYMRGFRDLDGHQWSFIHMDLSAVPAG